MILQRHGGPEQRHQTVAQILIHSSIIAMHGFGGHAQHVVHELVHDFGIKSLRQSGGISNVTKKHGDLLMLSL